MSSKPTNPKDIAATTRVPLALCSPIAKAEWAAAQHAGLCKYGAWNWRIAGVRASVYLSAAMRHLDAYLSGEETDPVDGTHHLGNVMACAAILLDAKAAGKLVDDRPPSVSLRPTYARAEATVKASAERYADRDPRHYTIADTPGALVDEWQKGVEKIADEARTALDAAASKPEPLKVGDRVRYIGGDFWRIRGREGTVVSKITGSGYVAAVFADDPTGPDPWGLPEGDLERIDP